MFSTTKDQIQTPWTKTLQILMREVQLGLLRHKINEATVQDEVTPPTNMWITASKELLGKLWFVRRCSGKNLSWLLNKISIPFLPSYTNIPCVNFALTYRRLKIIIHINITPIYKLKGSKYTIPGLLHTLCISRCTQKAAETTHAPSNPLSKNAKIWALPLYII